MLIYLSIGVIVGIVLCIVIVFFILIFIGKKNYRSGIVFVIFCWFVIFVVIFLVRYI